MTQINRPPLGLQGLLGTQSFGQNPGEALQEVRPIVDMLPFWQTQLLRAATAVGQRDTPGLINNLESGVTQDVNSYWMLYAVAVYLQSVGTVAAEIQVGVFLDELSTSSPTVTPVPIAVSDVVSVVPNDEFAFVHILPRPLILEVNVQLEYRYLRNTMTGSPFARAIALYHKLPTG